MRAIYLSEALRMFSRRVRVSFFGMKKYRGNAEQICRQVILDCYDQKREYFRTSAGHFCEFYCRDFGWSAESLLKLGYRKEVLSTLKYAMSVFERHGRVEQTISPGGVAFTFPDAYSPDALAFLVHALRVSNARGLVKEHRVLLEREAVRYFESAVDEKTGLIRKGMHFSSMKDYAVRSSSCYDNVMTAMLKKDLSALGLANPFERFDYESLLKRHFWKKSYFLDDLSGRKAICGDANVLPFWAGVLADREMLAGALHSVMGEHLDEPFPLKYTSSRLPGQMMVPYEFFAGDYERDAIWAHVGLMYIAVFSGVDKSVARNYLRLYEKKIDEHKNFLEVYDRNGNPFRTLLYHSDEGMLWAANFLQLRKQLGV